MVVKNRVFIREGKLSPRARQALEQSGAFGTGEHDVSEYKLETTTFACEGEPKKSHVVAREKVGEANIAVR